MGIQFNVAKGIHPGVFLERELRKKKLSKGRFALSVKEYPQTLSAIIKGKRSLNTPLAMRIEKELGMEEGLLMTLQVFYDINEEKKKQAKGHRPQLSRLRRALFWDTDIEKIDWDKQKRAVINRVFERGNAEERDEIIAFYGSGTVNGILAQKNRD